MVIFYILILVFILGIIILIHELGHFLFAKKFGVHIYEFSIGMGPVMYSKKGKDGVDYNLRAIPIGGFVSMAGEVYEDAPEEEKLAKDKYMCNKSWWQRIVVLAAGVVNNYILAVILLFIIAIAGYGSTVTTEIYSVQEDSAIEEAGIVKGDTILSINGDDVKTWDKAFLLLYIEDEDGIYDFEIKHENGKVETYEVEPKVEKNAEGVETKVFGVTPVVKEVDGFIESIQYAFERFWIIIDTMLLTLGSLFNGSLSLSALDGPIGLYEVVEESAKAEAAIMNLVNLTAILSINVGFINILPFPAFDGGRILFILIEKIKGSPVDSKIENIFHLIGFALLMLLTIYVAINDIVSFF